MRCSAKRTSGRPEPRAERMTTCGFGADDAVGVPFLRRGTFPGDATVADRRKLRRLPTHGRQAQVPRQAQEVRRRLQPQQAGRRQRFVAADFREARLQQKLELARNRLTRTRISRRGVVAVAGTTSYGIDGLKPAALRFAAAVRASARRAGRPARRRRLATRTARLCLQGYTWP